MLRQFSQIGNDASGSPRLALLLCFGKVAAPWRPLLQLFFGRQPFLPSGTISSVFNRLSPSLKVCSSKSYSNRGAEAGEARVAERKFGCEPEKGEHAWRNTT